MKEKLSTPSENFSSKNGFFNINKPKGWKSMQVINYIKRNPKLRKIKLGHMGTLDPIADGVLIIAINRAVRLFEFFKTLKKVYLLTVRLGLKTDTDDITGTKIEEKEVPELSEEDILSVLKEFVGEIEQIPPKFSAVRIDGDRAYNLARDGKEVPLQPKKVKIYSIDMIEFRPPLLKLKVECGGGTYMRALARDIGDKLNCGGTVADVRRLKVGPFDINESVSPENLIEDPEKYFVELTHDLFNLPTFEITSSELYYVKHGNLTRLKRFFPLEGYFVLKIKDRLIGIGTREGGSLRFINLEGGI